jgi:MerR family transcriptional regulator, redox-sensitive transcriptional activator SoxR
MREMAIGEIARRAGIQTSAIRYYESVGLLPPPRRTANGRRRYDASVLPRLALIQQARQAGFHIADLQVLLTGFPADTPPSARWQRMATEKIEEMDALIARSQAVKAWLTDAMKCQCERIDDCAGLMNENGSISAALSCGDSPAQR